MTYILQSNIVKICIDTWGADWTAERKAAATAALLDADLDSDDTWGKIYMWFGGARVGFWLSFQSYMQNDHVWWESFRDVWAKAEWLMHDEGEAVEESIREHWDGRYMVMDDEERAVFGTLPEEFEVYRGVCAHDDLDECTGWSWTLDRGVAEFFASRTKMFFGRPTVVVKGKVRKSDVVGYLDARNEKEIIVFPQDVSDITFVCDGGEKVRMPHVA